jgi:hypothetical protein
MAAQLWNWPLKSYSTEQIDCFCAEPAEPASVIPYNILDLDCQLAVSDGAIRVLVSSSRSLSRS